MTNQNDPDELLAEFSKLLKIACNTSFDCGEFNLNDSNLKEYDSLVEKSCAARSKIYDMYESAIKANNV